MLSWLSKAMANGEKDLALVEYRKLSAYEEIRKAFLAPSNELVSLWMRMYIYANRYKT